MKEFAAILRGTSLAVLLAAGMLAPLTLRANTATDTVERLHAGLLDVMQQAQRLGFEGRRARLAPLIDASYDLAFVVEIIFAPRWDKLDAEARRRCLEVFTRLTVATYAARFDGYAGETFETLSEQRMNSGRIHVRTQLSQVDGDRIQLDYVLRDVDGDARIVNVVADGVSDLALKRAEYAAVMQTDGLDGLLARLEAQTAAYTAEGAPPASG